MFRRCTLTIVVASVLAAAASARAPDEARPASAPKQVGDPPPCLDGPGKAPDPAEAARDDSKKSFPTILALLDGGSTLMPAICAPRLSNSSNCLA